MIDVGGTTTDVGAVNNSTIATDRHGSVKGVPISYEMSNVHSTGVGGSSVITVEGGAIARRPRECRRGPRACLLRLRRHAGDHHGREPAARRARSGHVPQR